MIKSFVEEVLMPVFVGALVIFLIIVPAISVPVYFSCRRDAKIINEQFHTHYSGMDMFLSGDTIKELLIGKKFRLEQRP